MAKETVTQEVLSDWERRLMELAMEIHRVRAEMKDRRLKSFEGNVKTFYSGIERAETYLETVLTSYRREVKRLERESSNHSPG